MKRLATIVIAGALTGILAAPAQTNFNLWLTTDGAGVQVNTAPRPVYYPGFYYDYDGPCYHHGKKLRKRYKKMRKAHKKYIKAQKKYYKEMRKHRHHHHHHHHDDD